MDQLTNKRNLYTVLLFNFYDVSKLLYTDISEIQSFWVNFL